MLEASLKLTAGFMMKMSIIDTVEMRTGSELRLQTRHPPSRGSSLSALPHLQKKQVTAFSPFILYICTSFMWCIVTALPSVYAINWSCLAELISGKKKKKKMTPCMYRVNFCFVLGNVNLPLTLRAWIFFSFAITMNKNAVLYFLVGVQQKVWSAFLR